MNDLDRDLREMFRRREGDVLIPPTTPAPVLRRTKRRQLGTVLTASVAVLAVAVAAVAGVAALRDGRPSQIPGVNTSDGMRTTVGPYAAATYPASWLASVDGPDLALTNFDPGLSGHLCDRIDGTMPADGVALVVMPNVGDGPWRTPTPIDDSSPWPVPVPSEELQMTDPTDCLGTRTFRAAGWTAPNGLTFRAWLISAPGADDVDVAALDAAFVSLTFPADDQPAVDAADTLRDGAPGIVLESGVIGGTPWNLVAFEGVGISCVRCPSSIRLEVEQPGVLSSDAIDLFSDAIPPLGINTTLSLVAHAEDSQTSRIVGAVVYGQIGDDVATVEAVGTGVEDAHSPARIFDAPPSLDIGSRLVVGSVEGEVDWASAVGYLADGSEVPGPPQQTGAVEIIGQGTDPLAGDWTVRVKPLDGSILLSIHVGGSGGGVGVGPLNGRVFGGWSSAPGPEAGDLLGVVRADVARVDVVFDDGTVIPSTILQIPEGPIGSVNAFLAFVPAELMGSDLGSRADLVAYDAAGTELGRQPAGTDVAVAPPPEIEAAWSLLERARDELVRYAEQDPFDELRIVATIDSNIDYLVSGDPPHGRPEVGRVTVRVDDGEHLVALTRTESGQIYCVGIEIAGGANVRYGSLNALSYDECTGGWS